MSVQPLIDPQWSWVYAVLVGQQWPQGDEDKLRGAAQAWTDAINGLLDIADGGDATARNVNYSVQAVSADQFNTYWDQWVNGDDSYIGELAKQCEVLAANLLQQAQETEYTKLTIDITVVIVIIQLAVMLALAAATAGGSLTGWALAITIGRQAVIEAVLRFVEQVIAAELPDVIAQTIMMAEGHESGWDWGKTGQSVAGGVVGGIVGSVAGAAGGKLFGKAIEDIATDSLGGKLGKLAAETALHSAEGAVTNGATSLITAGGASVVQSVAAGDSADKIWSNLVTAEGQAAAGLPAQALSGAGMGAAFHLAHAAGSALSPYHGSVTTMTLDNGKQVRAYQTADGYKVVDDAGFPLGAGTMADDHSTFTIDRSTGQSQTIDLTKGGYSVTDPHGMTVTHANWNADQQTHTDTYVTHTAKTDVTVPNPDGTSTTLKAGSTVTHYGNENGPVIQADVPNGSSVQRFTLGQDGTLSLAGWQHNTALPGLGTVHTDYFTAAGDKVASFNGWTSHTDVSNQAAYHTVFSDPADRSAGPATQAVSTDKAVSTTTASVESTSPPPIESTMDTGHAAGADQPPAAVGQTSVEQPVDAFVLGGSGTPKSYQPWSPGSKVVAAPEDNRNQVRWQGYEKQGRAFRDSENPKAVPTLRHGDEALAADDKAKPKTVKLDQVAADGTMVDAKTRSPGVGLDKKQLTRVDDAVQFWVDRLRTPEGRQAWQDWATARASAVEDQIVRELARRSGLPESAIQRPKVLPPDPTPPDLRVLYQISDAGVTDTIARNWKFPNVDVQHIPFGSRPDQAALFGDLVAEEDRFSVDALIKSEQNGIIDYFQRPGVQGILDFFKMTTIDPTAQPLRFATDSSPNNFDAHLYEWDVGDKYGTPSEQVKPALLYSDEAGQQQRPVKFDAYDQAADELIDRKLWGADHSPSAKDLAEAQRQFRALAANDMRARWEAPTTEVADKINKWLGEQVVDGHPLSDRMRAVAVPFDRDRVLAEFQQQHPEPVPTPIPAGAHDPAPPGISYLRDPAANKIAAALPHKDGVYYVVAHDELPVEPGRLRQDLLDNGWNGKDAVQFLLCDGAGLENRQAIADALGVPIGLADGKVWISGSGHYLAGPPELAAHGNFVPANITDNRWQVVVPTDHQGQAPDSHVFLDPEIDQARGERWQVKTPFEPGAVNRLDVLRTELAPARGQPSLEEPVRQDVAAVQLGRESARPMIERISALPKELAPEARTVVAGYRDALERAGRSGDPALRQFTVDSLRRDLATALDAKIDRIVHDAAGERATAQAEWQRTTAVYEQDRTPRNQSILGKAANAVQRADRNLQQIAAARNERYRSALKGAIETIWQGEHARLDEAYARDVARLRETGSVTVFDQRGVGTVVQHEADLLRVYRARRNQMDEQARVWAFNEEGVERPHSAFGAPLSVTQPRTQAPPWVPTEQLWQVSGAIKAHLAGSAGGKVHAGYVALIPGYEAHAATFGAKPTRQVAGHPIFETQSGEPANAENIVPPRRAIHTPDGGSLPSGKVQEAAGQPAEAVVSSSPDREHDAEAKAVNQILTGLTVMRDNGVEPHGAIVLGADKPMCHSCQALMHEIQAAFPGVQIYLAADTVNGRLTPAGPVPPERTTPWLSPPSESAAKGTTP
jgi:hypothetical protein